MTLSSESQRDEARKAWTDLTSVLGKETRGGKLLRDDVFVGVAFLGWSSLEVRALNPKFFTKYLADQESPTGGRECLQGSQGCGGPCGVQGHWRSQKRSREVALDAFIP